MSKVTIHIYTCDRCDKEFKVTDGTPGPLHDVTLTSDMHASLEYHKSLCDACWNFVVYMLEERPTKTAVG